VKSSTVHCISLHNRENAIKTAILFSTLKMEAIPSSETLVTLTRLHVDTTLKITIKIFTAIGTSDRTVRGMTMAV
jgi:hypothetical protein